MYASLTGIEIQRNRYILKIRYKIEHYFRITHEHHGTGKSRFTTIVKKNGDHLCSTMAFNIKRVILNLRKQVMHAAM
jgi:hypothetical protein